MTGIVILFGTATVAVWAVCRHLNRVAQQQPRHVHRPIVVCDGTVDLCECGELVNR